MRRVGHGLAAGTRDRQTLDVEINNRVVLAVGGVGENFKDRFDHALDAAGRRTVGRNGIKSGDVEIHPLGARRRCGKRLFLTGARVIVVMLADTQVERDLRGVDADKAGDADGFIRLHVIPRIAYICPCVGGVCRTHLPFKVGKVRLVGLRIFATFGNWSAERRAVCHALALTDGVGTGRRRPAAELEAVFGRVCDRYGRTVVRTGRVGECACTARRRTGLCRAALYVADGIRRERTTVRVDRDPVLVERPLCKQRRCRRLVPILIAGTICLVVHVACAGLAVIVAAERIARAGRHRCTRHCRGIRRRYARRTCVRRRRAARRACTRVQIAVQCHRVCIRGPTCSQYAVARAELKRTAGLRIGICRVCTRTALCPARKRPART